MNSVDNDPDDDLKGRLHVMESKLRRIRDQRNSHNESARRAADSRNSINEQAKSLRAEIEEKMNEQKEVRSKAKVHQARRDEIQKHVRQMLSRKKGRRDDGPSKSVVIQLSETIGEIERIENQVMTDGTLSLKKENRLIKKLRSLISRRDQLIPEVEKHQIISIDINDMDESIRKLRAEADNEHQLMIDANKLGDEIWDQIKPMLEERDFLRGEADRMHATFISEREKADEVHSSMKEMLSKVNEIRDELKLQRKERDQLVVDHNEMVRMKLKTPDEDDDLADSLSNQLMEQGSLSFGGTALSDSQSIKKSQSKKKHTRRLGTSRGRR